MILTESDIARLPERMKRELIRGENARAQFAIRAQTAIKESLDAMPATQIDGIGAKRMTIGADMAARIRQRYGWSCLHDPEFLRSLWRKNPFLRCNSTPGKLTVRVDGLRDRGNVERRTSNVELRTAEETSCAS